jgi:hypothetical protein
MPGPVLEQLPEAEDRVERGAQLVAHAGQELALGGVGPVGLLLGVQRRRGDRAAVPAESLEHAGDLAQRGG